jgi:hypothetical protein
MANQTTPVLEIKALTGKKGQPIIPKIHTKYDELVEINSIIDNPEQETVYKNTSRENYDRKAGETMEDAEDRFLVGLANNIAERGLEQIPVVMEFTDGKRVFKSGHTRRRAFRKLNATHIPITIIPQEISFDEYMLPSNLIRRTNDVLGSNVFDKERQHVPNLCKQIFQIMEKFKTLHKYDMPDSDVKELCKTNGLETKYYNMAMELKKNWPEMWDVVCNMDKTLVPAYNEWKQKQKQAATNRPSSPAGDTLFNNSDSIREITSIVASLMVKLNDVKLRFRGTDLEFLDTIQANIKSGLLHEAVVKASKNVLSAETGYKWDAPVDMKYDLDCKTLDLVIDVKTRVEGSKSWVCAANNIKGGYYLFCETNDDLSRWFVAYGHTKGEEWSKKQTVGVYTNEVLAKNKNMNILIGQLKKDGKVYLDPII